MTIRRRSGGGPDLFQGLDSRLTLEEAGALLGISDHTAMLAEKSAEQKLRSIFAALGLSSLRDFISIDDEALSAILARFSSRDLQYSDKFGWYPLTRARSLNEGSESLKSMAAAYAVLRVEQANRFRVPILFRPGRDAAFSPLGHVEAISMIGPQALFRSMELRKLLREHCSPQLHCIAIVESECGVDQFGKFDIPIIVAVLVTWNCT